MVEFTVNMFTYLVNCQLLDDIINGSIACYLTPSNEDICNITCNKGYVLIGSDTRTCMMNGSWSGTDGSCQLGNSLSLLLYCNIFIVKSCMKLYVTVLNNTIDLALHFVHFTERNINFTLCIQLTVNHHLLSLMEEWIALRELMEFPILRTPVESHVIRDIQ